MSMKPVGVVVGEPTVFGFTLKISGRVGRNDFIEVSYEDRIFVLIVKDIRRSKDGLYASCEVLGVPPKTPFEIGAKAYLASEDNVRRALGLTFDSKTAVYLGLLKGYSYRIFLPVKRLNRIFIVGKPGSGKSYTAGVLIEEFLKKGIPVIVVDVHGEYSSLKVKADSPCSEFNVSPKSYADKVVEFGDLTVNSGADLDINQLRSFSASDLVLAGQCVIINLRGLSNEEQVQIVAELTSKLLEAAIKGEVKPFYLFLDEAHRFAGREKLPSVPILRKFSQEGRKFGANLIVITQRPQLLDTTVRSLSGTWIIHRLTDPNDVRIAIEGGGLSKEWEKDIVWLESGEAIITGEAVERIPLLVRVRCRETRHGAPGFNPLDFVSVEELEKARRRVRRLLAKQVEFEVSRPPTPPKIPHIIKQFYVKAKFNDKHIHEILRGMLSFKAELISVRGKYAPAIYFKALISIDRSKPPISFNWTVDSLVPALEGLSDLSWFSREAFGVCMEELKPSLLMDKAEEEMAFMRVASELLSIDGIKSIRSKFVKSITSSTSWKIHYHSAFKLSSKPNEDFKSFKKRVDEEFEDRLKLKIDRLKAKYDREIGKHNARLKSLGDEVIITSHVLNEILREIKELKASLIKVRRDGRSTLKISGQIRSRELKVARLKRKLNDLNIKIKDEREAVKKLKEEFKDKLKSIRSSLLKQRDSPIKTILLFPKESEVELEDLRLIWIPKFNATVKASNDIKESIIDIQWNGVNGKGNFGLCIYCGEVVNELHDNWLCSICLSPICTEHVKICSKCKSAICPEHSWTCSVCESTFCVNEPKFECEVCGELLCEECARRCVKCGLDKTYCSKHIKICNDCALPYCEVHYESHLVECEACSRRVCSLATTKCDICGGLFCQNCITQCSKCHINVCVNHSWRCDVCGEIFCVRDERYVCSICGKTLCEKHAFKCPACGRTLCPEHVIVCPNCERRICPSCTVTIKRFFKTKKGCKLCLKP